MTVIQDICLSALPGDFRSPGLLFPNPAAHRHEIIVNRRFVDANILTPEL